MPYLQSKMTQHAKQENMIHNKVKNQSELIQK